MNEHHFEPIRGLPGDLPKGEHILWQGAPDLKTVAREVFHVPLVCLYFFGLMAWRVADATAAGASAAATLQAALGVAPLMIAAVGLLAGLAWVNCRTTVYTITNRRVVMRFGAAFTKAINIPFAIIEGADAKGLAFGAGDISLTLKAPNKIAYFQLWPHARPGKLLAPQPTLRCIANAQQVAATLADALRRATGQAPGAATTTGATPAANPAPIQAALA